MRTKRFPKLTMVLVTWEDTTSDAKWHDKQEIENAKAIIIRTIGFFIENKKRALKIAHSTTSDGDSDYTIIPWGCIVSISELEVK